MTAVLALALLAPTQPPVKQQNPFPFPLCGNDLMLPVRGFGLAPESEFHWPFFIVTSPDVQKELKLTKEQIKAFDDAQADLKKAVAGLGTLTAAQKRTQVAKLTKWADETVHAVLARDQRDRHRQIVWQVLECYGGPRGLAANITFAKDIGLTLDQQAKAKKIDADYLAAWEKLVRTHPLIGNGPVPGEEELAKKSDEAVLKLLTDAQKKAWNEALGEPFKGEVKQFPIPGLRPVPFKAPAEKK